MSLDLLDILLIVVIVGGQTELIVTTVNRVHGLPWSDRCLGKLRHFHEFLLPLGIPVVAGWILFLRPGLWWGGTWEDLVGWEWGYIAVSAVGFVGLVCSAIRYRLKRPSTPWFRTRSRVVDVEQELGFRPAAKGPYHFLTKLPGNEVFRVEVNEKFYRLPGLPVEWDGLSIVHLSDFHLLGTIDLPFYEHTAKIVQELQPDLLVFTGDLLDRQDLVSWLPRTLGQLQAPLGGYFILGNHDWHLDHAAIRQEVSRLGWHDLAGRNFFVEHRGHRLEIGGTERPWMGEHPPFADKRPGEFRLLLSHTPDNFRWAQQQNVDLMLSGHNHGGQVRLPLIGPVYSPSLHGCKYASGDFLAGPTLLHVSRGLSGKHPLRLNCKPELTRIVLRPALPTADAEAAETVEVLTAE